MNPLIQLTAFLVVATLSSSSIVKSPPTATKTDNFELLILHNNDMHARFEQTSQLSGTCTTADRDAGKCYGGFPRVATVVKEARKKALTGEGPPVLYLNAGDTYTGSAWFTIYKWKIAAEFINALQPDAVSLNNDEIKNGSPFLNNINTKIISSNIMLKDLEDNNKIQKSIVLDIDARKVGIVGYLKLDTKDLDSTGSIEYVNEILALKEEVAKLEDLNVDIIIALGHSNSEVDIEIAKEVEGIDIVIGGRKNIFYWNGNTAQTSIEEPVVVTQNSGKKVLVVKSSAYNRYLGNLNIKFDENGNIIEYNTKPILLDETVPQDPEYLRIVNKYSEEITSTSEEIVGQTSVVLDGDSCRVEECNFGNLVTDAIMYYYAVKFEGNQWTDAPIAIINGATISSSISPSNRPASITKGDILAALPVESDLAVVTINGEILNELLEYAVTDYNFYNPSNGFIQSSGVRVVYNLERSVGSRIVSAVVRCAACSVPQFQVIDNSKAYKVIVPTSLLDSHYGFDRFQGQPTVNLEYDILTCLTYYLSLRTPVYPEVSGRIVLHGNALLSSVSSAIVVIMVTFIPIILTLFQSLGNHEFDNGVSGLTPFIENLTSPVLAANLILTKVPELAAENNLKKSIILNVDGHKIGIIGYLTPDTKILAVKNDVEYIDEVVALQDEVTNLQSQGIKIIIALGHSGYARDLEIAKEVDGLDLVIGGHSNTFLWNGETPDTEAIQGPYPTYVTQSTGRQVPVVQAYAYTKYLGKLHITFDSDGEVVSVDGNPILLNSSFSQDPQIVDIVERYREGVTILSKQIVGSTRVSLDGLSCQDKECNMGNLITDAMIYKYAEKYKGKYWTDAAIAVIQGGGIRTSIAHPDFPAAVTEEDLLNVLPFQGSLVTVTLNGSTLIQMLEHASLGNHEFDEGVDGVVPFIRNLTSPVLAANLILDKVPELQDETNLYNAIVLSIKGNRIGIIGYLTPETKFLAPRNKVEYEDEVIALRREVNKLKDQGVNIIIALGHSGFYKDLEIAKNVNDLDIVIGGHSNTFLYNGIKSDEKPEIPQGPYPTIVKQSTGKSVLVVQAYAYTKYIGQLHVTFNPDGEIVEYDGSPLLLNQKVPDDPELLETINRYRSKIDLLNSESIGESSVFLNGECRLRECNIGDLITDSILNYTRRYYKEYSDVNIAIVQGGRIRASIDQPEKPYNMTRNDWMTVLPFSDPLAIVTMNGTILKGMLEHSVSTWRLVDSTGQFLQMSGIEVVYDLTKPPGSRVTSAKAVCAKCDNMQLRDVKDYYEYKVFMPSFLAAAGDGYTIFENLPNEQIQYNELECVLDYIKHYGPINVEITGRLTINNEDKVTNEFNNIFGSKGLTLSPNISIYCIIIFVCYFVL
ncbi:uncharacterized protein LOC131851320 [Achroia grisella]|uniref:uncharacterized protein LOC131851320 n=1 Tax=Achroia grisella TaxID=688607 RepID=UPI0027D2DB77|nr:uncharacterized protein LOC131851320 [Achroia grisella]